MAGADEIAQMLAQCLADPEDDEPRLVWADAIGGERGELVVVQCDLARHQRQPELAPHEVAARRRRERELLARHGAAWSGLADLATGWTFHRGFVEAARVDLDVLANDPAAPFAAAPLLRSLSIANLAGPVDPDTRRVEQPRPVAAALGMLARTLASPALAKLRALDVIEPSGWADTTRHRHGLVPIADDVAALLAAYAPLPALRALGISGGALGSRGMEALGALAQHARLEALWLRNHVLVEGDLTSLLARFPDVVALDTASNPRGLNPAELVAIPPLLERPLVSLAADHVVGRSLAALAASPAGQTLEHLAIDQPLFRSGELETLDRLPRLRSLELAFPHGTSDDCVRALAELRLPALRELSIGSYATAFSLGELAGSFGDRLDVLDIRGTHVAHGPVIVGEVLVHDVAPVALLDAPARPALAAAHRATRNQLLGVVEPAAFLVSLDGQVWEIPALDLTTIGRVIGNDIVLTRDSVSRRHCELTWRDGAHHITDLGSAGGTYVDRERVVGAVRLADGATVQIGGAALRYYVGDGARDRIKRWIVEPRATRP